MLFLRILFATEFLSYLGERPYVCEICKRAFNQKGSLQTHIIMHSGTRPHKCDFCDATFAQKGNLRAHIKRLHAVGQIGQSVYRCYFCSCIFRKIGNLNAHLTKMHTDVNTNGETRPIITHELNASASETNENSETQGHKNVNDVINQLLVLSKHVQDDDDPEKTQQQIRKLAEEGQVNADILQQALENSGLPTSDQDKAIASAVDKVKNASNSDGAADDNAIHGQRLRKYVVNRSAGHKWNQCPYCAKEFKKPSDLVRHIRIHTHEKPFKCKECYRAFTLKSTMTAHMKCHVGIKEHCCTYCDKFFSTSGSLKVCLVIIPAFQVNRVLCPGPNLPRTVPMQARIRNNI